VIALQGNPEEWLADLISVSELMNEQVIPAAWPKCREKMGGVLCHEDKVTKPFVIQLHKAKRTICPNMSFQIVPQFEVYPSDDETGIIDIAVLLGGDEELYLGYECKWLEKNKNKKSDSQLVGEYLGEGGLGCFTSGKYAPGMPVGHMVGYVASGDVSLAENKIESRMVRRSLPQPIGHQTIGETRQSKAVYQRDDDLHPIEITHILLPYQ
jgi:hypothetical protein